MRRGGENACGGSGFHDSARIEDGDRIGAVGNEREVVGDQDQREPVSLAQSGQQLHNGGGRAGVEGGGHLIADEHIRFGGQSTRNSDPLPLPTGQLVRIAPRVIGVELDLPQQLGHPVRHITGIAAAMQPQRTAEGRADTATGIERTQRALRHELNTATFVPTTPPQLTTQLDTIERDSAAARRMQADHGAGKTGLSGTGRTNNPRRRTRRHREIDIAKHLLTALRESHVQTAYEESRIFLFRNRYPTYRDLRSCANSHGRVRFDGPR